MKNEEKKMEYGDILNNEAKMKENRDKAYVSFFVEFRNMLKLLIFNQKIIIFRNFLIFNY